MNAVEEELAISRGHLGRIIRGERWKETVDIDIARRLAELLHVTPEWLLFGTGTRRRAGRAETRAEQAIAFARMNGAREDAIKSAWERNKDREAEMSPLDWVNAINAEASRLAGIPRPEAIRGAQQKIRRTKRQIELAEGRAKKAKEEADAKQAEERGHRLRLAGGSD